MPRKSTTPPPRRRKDPRDRRRDELDEVHARFPRILARWLDLFEASLEAAGSAEGTPAARAPDVATLREIVHALTICIRLQQLAGEDASSNEDLPRRDIEAVERALSESVR